MKDTEQSASMLPGTFGPMAVLVILAGVISALILQLVANDRMSAMAGTMSVAVCRDLHNIWIRLQRKHLPGKKVALSSVRRSLESWWLP